MTSYFSTLITYLKLAFKVYWSGKRYTKNVLTELKTFEISKSLLSRIEFYIFQMVLVNSWTEALHRKKITNSVYRKAMFLATLTPILDDITDMEKSTSIEILKKLKSNSLSTDNERYKIAHKLYSLFIENNPNLDEELFIEALKAQDDSIKQLEKNQLSENELIIITKMKGGLWTLLYWTTSQSQISKKEKDAVMSLGYALQLTNDMFDVYKDQQNQQQTLFTNTTDIRLEKKRFENLVSNIEQQFSSLDYPTTNIRKCLLEISTILGRGMVCITQLEALQKTTNNSFLVNSYKRKDLICDMEKPSNIWKSVRFSIDFYRKLRS